MGLIEGYDPMLQCLPKPTRQSTGPRQPDEVLSPALILGCFPKCNRKNAETLPLVLAPDFMVPVSLPDEKHSRLVTRSQAALSLLAALDTLTAAICKPTVVRSNHFTLLKFSDERLQGKMMIERRILRRSVLLRIVLRPTRCRIGFLFLLEVIRFILNSCGC